MVLIIEPKNLGIENEGVRLQSIHSGGVMAMFLSGTSVIMIYKVDYWSSDPFLEYIRKEDESFTLKVSSNMLKFEEFIDISNNNETITYNKHRDVHLK